MARGGKVTHYIAFSTADHPHRRSMADAAFDMMRYDRCYPATNTPDGWIVFEQPHQGSEYYAVTLPEGIPDDAALLFDEIAIDGRTSQLVQIKRAPKRGGK